MEGKRSGLRDPGEWTRDVPGRKLAGVCVSVAENLGVSVSVVRAAFLLLALWHGFGILLYLVLWLLMPPATGEPSVLDEVLDTVRGLFTSRQARSDRERSASGQPDDRSG